MNTQHRPQQDALPDSKALCRHYCEFNPQATASYINACREMWDSDDRETETETHSQNS
jgi:hypothetical protein